MDYELVDRYFEAVEEEQALADSTLRTYAYAIRDFCRHLEKLGAASLDEVAKSDVFDYVRDQMDRGISASTINTRLVALKSLFRHLHAYGLIDANPMSKFGPRRSISSSCRQTLQILLISTRASRRSRGTRRSAAAPWR